MALAVEDYSRFPALTLPSGSQLFRMHSQQLHPEHYSSSSMHRFDPPPDRQQDYGVCYLAFEPLGSYVEVLGRIQPLFEEVVDGRRLSTAHLTRKVRLADLTNRSVLGGFGVTGGHSMDTSYLESQHLSSRLFDSCFDGVAYRVKHDPLMELEAVALFKSYMTNQIHSSPLAWGEPEAISEDLIHAGHEFGLVVQPRPHGQDA